MSTLANGMDCPDFCFAGADGAAVTRADLLGKPFVLFFYPKDDTSGCTQEAVAFSALAGDFEAAGVALFGVSPDSPKSHAKFRQKHDLVVTLLSDEEKVSLGAFGVWVEKSMYGRRYMGVERTTVLVGADGRIRRIWPKVKVAGHAQEVLDAAREVAPA